MSHRAERKENEIDIELLSELRTRLESKHVGRNGKTNGFVHPEEAREILTQDQLHTLLKPFSWYEDEHLTLIWHTMTLIVCVLITTHWENWFDFRNYFFRSDRGLQNPRFCDEDLPFSEAALAHLPAHLSHAFQRCQYIFLPVFITEDSHHIYNKSYRLPLHKIEHTPEWSASFSIEKVQVEARFLLYSDGYRNANAECLARKRLTSRTTTSQLNDLWAVEQIKMGISTQPNIREFFSSLTHGCDIYFLWAWDDNASLDVFLHSPETLIEAHSVYSLCFAPYHLLAEAYSLATAIDFLHNHLFIGHGRRLVCSELDLAPKTILISFPAEAVSNNFPVGQWKITNFGTPTTRDLRRHRYTAADASNSSKATQSPHSETLFEYCIPAPGPFRPPETHDWDDETPNAKSDVWSLGCILAMILAFALGGPEEVKAQDDRRRPDGFFHRLPLDQFAQSSTTPFGDVVFALTETQPEVKPAIRNWLEDAHNLTHDIHSSWVRQWSDTILRLLEIDGSRRPEIKDAVQNVAELLKKTEGQYLTRHCLWYSDNLSRPAESNTPRIELIQQLESLVMSDVDRLPPLAGHTSSEQAIPEPSAQYTRLPRHRTSIPHVHAPEATTRSSSLQRSSPKPWQRRSIDQESLRAIVLSADAFPSMATASAMRRTLSLDAESIRQGAPSLAFGSMRSGEQSLKQHPAHRAASPVASDCQKLQPACDIQSERSAPAAQIREGREWKSLLPGLEVEQLSWSAKMNLVMSWQAGQEDEGTPSRLLDSEVQLRDDCYHAPWIT